MLASFAVPTKVQLVPTVVVKRDRGPSAKDGAASVAMLSELDNGNMPAKKDLVAAGFTEKAPGLWIHADGSWVKHDKLDQYNALQFGIGSDRLSQLPEFRPKVDTSTSRSDTRPSIKDKSWAWFRKNTAMGTLGAVNDDATGKAQLMRAGFITVARRANVETWVHPDGSWFKSDFQGNGIADRGWKGYADFELQAGDHKDLTKHLKEKPRIPSSMRRHALATVGRVDSSSVDATCKAHGFVKVGNHYIHPDGSWVKNDNGAISVGWKGHPLQNLPYAASGGWR